MENFNDVSDAFAEFTQKITVSRQAVGSYVNGKWDPGASGGTTMMGVIQSATPEDTMVLPEGLRTEVAIKVHTVSQLKPVSTVGVTGADSFLYRGSTWVVQAVSDRAIGGYYKAIATRKTE